MTMTSSDRPAGAPRRRRSFTAEQKADFVRRYDETPKGSKGAFLREHNLYDTHIKKWRDAAAHPARGLKPDPIRARLAELEAEKEALLGELAASRRTADALGKAFALLEEVSKSANPKK